MKNMVYPENYRSALSQRDTQKAIKIIKDTFQQELGKALKRVAEQIAEERSAKESVENLRRGDGLVIDEVPLYDTRYASSQVLDLKEILETGEADFAVFTSASTVRGFAGAAGDADLTKVRAVCIGRQTEAEAKKHGMRTWTAEKATLDSLCDRLEQAAAALRAAEPAR